MEDQKEMQENQYDVVSVEKLVAYYAGEQLAKPYEMYRLSTFKGARIYFRFLEDNTPRFYMGATSASKYLMTPQLLKWWADGGYEKRQQDLYDKSTYGSFYHATIAQLASGKVLSVKELRQGALEYFIANEVSTARHNEYTEMIVKDVLAYLAWCEKFEVKPLAIEMPLCSDTIGVATLIDFVGTLNDSKLDESGEVKKSRGAKPKHPKVGVHSAIVDFKSGRSGTYESHIMQLQSNKEMFEENFPNIEPIKYFYNFHPKDWRKDTPTYSFINQTDKMNQDRYDALLTLAKSDIENVLNRSILTIEGEVKFGTTAKSLIRKMTIKEIVETGEWQSFTPKEVKV